VDLWIGGGESVDDKDMKVINKKARFDYELGERVEAGIELTGAEVKSAKLGQVDMENAHVKMQASRFKGQNEMYVINLHIYPYKHADNTNYDPKRMRKLLLHQKEIIALQSKMKQSSRILIPTAMYTKSNYVKIELALARGKRKYEKREKIKERDLEREEK
jgi:SsrA-binding protein